MGINFPSSPVVGTLYPDPAVNGVPQYTWDGEKWTSGTGSGAIYISDDAPAAPVGSLWWESDTGILYVRYFDGSSTQWVAIAGGDVTVNKAYVDAGDATVIPHSGYFSYLSATQAIFKPWNGDRIRINGVNYQIPAAGIVLTNSGLAASTLYYVYMNSSLAIVVSTTAPVVSSTPGNVGTLIGTSDALTLIGMLRTNGSIQFAAANVISWFNKKTRSAQISGPAALGITGNVEFCSWADEAVSYHLVNTAANGTVNAIHSCAPVLDNVVTGLTAAAIVPVATGQVSVSLSGSIPVTAGWHTIGQSYAANGTPSTINVHTLLTFRG